MRWVCLIALLAWPVSSWAAGAFVQVKGLSTDSTAATTIAVTMDSNVAANELLAVGFGWGTSDVTPTCAGSRAGSLTVVEKNWDAGKGGFGMCYGVEPSAGAETVTVTFGSSVAFRMVCAATYSGAATSSPLDVSEYKLFADTTGTSGVATTDAFVTTVTNAVVFGFSSLAALGSTYTAGTNYTSRAHDNANTSTADFMCQDRLNAPTGSQTASWSTNNGPAPIQVGVMAFFDDTATAPTFMRRRVPQ